MKIRELMTSQAFTCSPQDSLARAAMLLWEHDCGMLPVVDGEGRVGATITDRDICMGALTRGGALEALRVADSMSKGVVTCKPDEDIETVVARMCAQQLHRLPVVDADGRPCGVLALNDLATIGDDDPRIGALAQKVLVATCRHRTGLPVEEPPAPAAARRQPPATKPAGKQQGKGSSAGGPAV